MTNRPQQPPIVDLRDVSKTYEGPGGGYRALSDVTCRLSPGELVAIVGRSGSGKSTLLNLLTGIDRPSGGKVLVGGIDVHGLDESRLAAWRGAHVGVVFQFFQLLPTLTVAENVALPMDFCGTYPPRERGRRARALLDRVGIADQADKLPLTLSGGQQQRVAIARALANDPMLIVADEPTGNLDTRTGEAVWALFGQLAAEGKTVVVVTHDRGVRRMASRVLGLDDGRIVSDEVGGAGGTGAEALRA